MRNNYFSEKYWKDPTIANNILKEIFFISKKIKRNVNIMEVCGTHTMSIAASGIRNVLPDNVNLISGPGCPVCVTSAGDIDRIISLSEISGDKLIITTFGDMLKVPGSGRKSLSDAKVRGADVRVVYSPMDAIKIAKENPSKEVVFVGVGFETTAPLIALTVIESAKNGVNNFSVTPLFKLVPPALRFLLDSKIAKIDAFLLPGHVSAIIGYEAYDFLTKDYSMPGTIAGFEPLDILRGVELLLKQIESGKAIIDVEYSRAVKREGNKTALSIMKEVYGTYDAQWRAIGPIKNSGYTLSGTYERYDAFKKFSIEEKKAEEPAGCLCGKVLLGLVKPNACHHFAKGCTPQTPIGPCMVSSEGACTAWYKYGLKR